MVLGTDKNVEKEEKSWENVVELTVANLHNSEAITSIKG
jgi:hypothetical protein